METITVSMRDGDELLYTPIDSGGGEFHLDAGGREYIAYGDFEGVLDEHHGDAWKSCTYSVDHAPTQRDFDAIAAFLNETLAYCA